MCRFFSVVTKGDGRLLYFSAEQRKELTGSDYNMDSHTSIASYHKVSDDKVNKYEYIEGKFIVDQINIKDDRGLAKKNILKLAESKEFKDIEKYYFSTMDSYYAYEYCRDVKDRKEVRDKITGSDQAYKYCKYVKDRKEVRDKITGSDDAYYYCRDVKDRKEVRDKITGSNYACYYCLDVKDRKEVRVNNMLLSELEIGV